MKPGIHEVAVFFFLAALAASAAAAPDKNKGRLEISLVPPPGAAKTSKVVVAVAKLGSVPWKPFLFFKAEGAGGGVDLPPGTYLVECGQRNARGDVFLALRVVTIEAGKKAAVELEGGLPATGKILAAGSDAPRLKKPPRSSLRATDKRSHSLSSLLRKGPVLLVFFSTEHEPSQRMLPKIAVMAGALAKAGIVLAGVQIKGGPSGPALKKAAEEKGMALPLMLSDRAGAWARAFGIKGKNPSKQLPLLVLLDKNRAVRFLQEGYDLNVKPKLEAVLQWARARAASFKGTQRGRP